MSEKHDATVRFWSRRPHWHDAHVDNLRRSPEHASAHDVAARYRRNLLNALGLAGVSTPSIVSPHPAIAWAASGAMALTGADDGPPLLSTGCVASCAQAALQTFVAVTGATGLAGLCGARLLAERAAIAGHRRRGRRSSGDSCRLLDTRTGPIALNLARPDDVALLPAWLETPVGVDVWGDVSKELANRDGRELVARGSELGLAVAELGETPSGAPLVRIAVRGTDHGPGPDGRPLVVDLSSLWAGPLATHLLERAGARVIKVESTTRPDGARLGPPAFYDLLNAGKQSIALDFRSRDDIAVLDKLLERADIVVEASRPRALRQLGIEAEHYVRRVPGLTWLAISGYGRDEPFAHRVAFGDDAAVAGALVAHDPARNETVFCSDAIADPLTGIHAALAAYGSWRVGGGRLLDIAMANVAAHVRGFAAMPDDARVTRENDEYTVVCGGRKHRVDEPLSRRAEGKAAALGRDTRAIVEELC